MSLIENALGRIRAAKQEQDAGSSTTARRAILSAPAARAVANPQLHVTSEMWAQFGIRTDAEFEHQLRSEYRHIKQQVVAEIREHPSERVILVASALSGDGKSYTTANLARSLAREPDHTVLLVDGDAVKPQVSRAFGLVDRPGLMNALADTSCDIESLVVTTDIEGLSILPAGSSSDEATEYFGSERMRSLLAQLQAVPNRIVLIDSLPILNTTEVRALLPLASQVLLVVRAETTPRSAVREAVAIIGDLNTRIVLNAAVRTRLSRYLGYGYGYGYNYDSLPQK